MPRTKHIPDPFAACAEKPSAAPDSRQTPELEPAQTKASSVHRALTSRTVMREWSSTWYLHNAANPDSSAHAILIESPFIPLFLCPLAMHRSCSLLPAFSPLTSPRFI